MGRGVNLSRARQAKCFPVEATVSLLEKGQKVTKTARFLRINNGTHEFKDDDEWEKFKSQRWPGSN